MRRRKGLLVQIVGPDGAGKSTLVERVMDEIGNRLPVHRSYWRPGALPMPRQLVGRGTGGLVTDPHGRDLQGHLRATVRLLYYAADFIVGHWLIYCPVLARGGIVIVERGWQDVIVDNQRYLIPSRLPARLLGRLIPRPDVIFILDAPPETILERKRELSLDEINRQLREWKATARARREVMTLDARQDASALAATVVRRIGRDLYGVGVTH
jgi:thymidylate kinase